MNSSPELNELATALAKAQGEMLGAVKDATNTFFAKPNSNAGKYADLESVWIACRKALTDNGLSVIQYGDEAGPVLITRLLHSSGQWIQGGFPIKAKDDSPQAIGSGITYARRYGLAAMVGVYQTDDDAEAAQGRHSEPGKPLGRPHTPKPEGYAKPPQHVVDEYVDVIRAYINVGDVRGLYAEHLKLNPHVDFYIAVGDCLDTKEKAALRAAVNAKGEGVPTRAAF